MGRLTLNVLLSFAQFEREVTGERIRDKIAASKKKGMWMGGTLPLGYDRPTDAATRALVVNDAEAATVRVMFTTYLELGSVYVLQRRLVEGKIRSKAYVTKTGKACGDLPFSRGTLIYLLRNRVCRGVMVHKTSVMLGIHPAVVEADLFDGVQASLDANARRHQARSNRVVSAALTGCSLDADGVAISPTFSHGARGQVYRYYVSASLQQGKRSMSEQTPGAIRRVPAVALEQGLTDAVERRLPGRTGVLALVARIEIYRDTVQMPLPVPVAAGARGLK